MNGRALQVLYIRGNMNEYIRSVLFVQVQWYCNCINCEPIQSFVAVWAKYCKVTESSVQRPL